MKKLAVRLACVATLAFTAISAHAQTEAAQVEMRAAAAAANDAVVKGPTEIDVKHEAVLKLKAGESFVPAAEAGRYLRSMGNSIDETRLVGLVLSKPAVALLRGPLIRSPMMLMPNQRAK